MINSQTLVNALNKALDTSEGFSPAYPAQVRLLYQNPTRSPQAITFGADSEVDCPTLSLALGHRVTFSGTVPAPIATGTFYAVPTTGTSFKVAASLADAEAQPPVTVTITGGSTGGFVFDLDITANDTQAVLEKYQVAAIAPVEVAKTTTTYNATTKKAVATYGPALFNGGASNTPISHTLTFFGGIPGQTSYEPFYDLTPATQPAIGAGGSLTVVVSIEAEAVAS